KTIWSRIAGRSLVALTAPAISRICSRRPAVDIESCRSADMVFISSSGIRAGEYLSQEFAGLIELGPGHGAAEPCTHEAVDHVFRPSEYHPIACRRQPFGVLNTVIG